MPREAAGTGPSEVPPLPLCRLRTLPQARLLPQAPGRSLPRPKTQLRCLLPSPVSSKIFLLTPVRPSSESTTRAQETLGLLSGSNLQGQDWGAPVPPEPRSAWPCLDSLWPRRGGPQEEGRTDEDSGQSDEELRCYSAQGPSSRESEEEVPPVPVVVAEKPERAQPAQPAECQAFCPRPSLEDPGGAEKLCPSSDDVTVYLFDQVSSCPGLGAWGEGALWWDWKPWADKCC